MSSIANLQSKFCSQLWLHPHSSLLTSSYYFTNTPTLMIQVICLNHMQPNGKWYLSSISILSDFCSSKAVGFFKRIWQFPDVSDGLLKVNEYSQRVLRLERHLVGPWGSRKDPPVNSFMEQTLQTLWCAELKKIQVLRQLASTICHVHIT